MTRKLTARQKQNFNAGILESTRLPKRAKAKPRKEPTGYRKCAYKGCRALVKTTQGRAYCENHQVRYSRRGGLKEEDLRLLALSKED